MKLVLASGSPRRSEILRDMGMEFEVNVPAIEEEILSHMTPEESAAHNALRKVRKVAQEVRDGILIGADTVVALDDAILTKPKDEEEAMSMLQMLSGKRHRVITGLAKVKNILSALYQKYG